MFEVTHPGKNHCQVVLVGGRYYFLVAHRSSGLNHSGNPGPRRFVDSIAKWKECVRGNNTADKGTH